LRLTTRHRFSAAHRLYTDALSPEENRALYGKCSNPFGHGHDYAIDITVEGPVNADGQVANRGELNNLVRNAVIARLDHRDLNRDVPEFAGSVPTTENLATVIRDLLERNWTLAARLVRVRISETKRNTFVWEAPAR
jgi:6-pyruvoyltetrahydropterin/6-carboxytetrahydropterin synthase